MPQPPKVFCSHRQVDKPAVEAFARRLREEQGIDAWLDKWEISPGDDFVRAINQGLANCEVGLVFFSSQSWDGKWFDAEVSTLKLLQVEDGIRLIPVMLDVSTPKPPPLLRRYARRSVDDFEQIVDAILNRSRKPPLGTLASEPQRIPFTLSLRREPAGTVAVEALRNGTRVAEQAGIALSANLAQAFAAFVRGDLKEGEAAQRLTPLVAHDLPTLGDQLGQRLCPGEVGAALAAALRAVNTRCTLEVCVDSDDAHLLALPWEALRLDGHTLALRPGVSLRRRVLGAPGSVWEAQASPLKILVAVGAPDEGKTPNTVLDVERELQHILDAVEPRAQQGNAEVRFLEVGHPDQLQKALQQDAYHVLHLSGHGGPGCIELEDEDGAPVRVTARELVRKLQAARRNVPLVFLSSCFGATPDAQSGAMAVELVRAGVPFVVAMQAGVTDAYAAELAHAFYAALAEREFPEPAQALATARQALEQQRQQALQRGEKPERHPAEYATAALYGAGEDVPLVDFALPRQPLAQPPVHQSTGPMPNLRLGDLVGRRRELRRVLRVLRNHPASVAEHGRLSGAVLTGIGGVGKSSVAGRVMARLQEDGWAVAAVAGRLALGPLCVAVALALGRHANTHWKEAAQPLGNPGLDDPTRVSLLCNLLQQTRLLLVLDNFEDNLSVGGEAFQDDTTAQLLSWLAQSAQRGRLLITCRYPVPGLEAELLNLPLPPLSAAEVRKLLWRLEGLKGLERADLAEVMRHVGGHPRMLEFLDALLRHGVARLPEVKRRLQAAAKAEGIDLKASPALPEALRHTALLGARTVLLDELLALARAQGDEEALRQLAVSGLPMSAAELAWAMNGNLSGAPVPPPEVGVMGQRLECLVSLSLVSPVEGGFWVHRWTAQALAQSSPEEVQRARCRRAGEFRLARGADQGMAYADAYEATYNFLAAAEFDGACGLALQIAQFHIQQQQTLAAVALASEVLPHLPNTVRDWTSLVDIEVQGHLQLGLTNWALQRTQEILGVFETRAQAEPGRADYQRGLSVSYIKLGDLMRAQGQGEQARELFEKSLGIAKRLAHAEPRRADYQRDLSASYIKLGDLMSVQNQGERAREFFEKSLSIAEWLVHAEPGRADYQRDLSVLYIKLGDRMRALDQSERAYELFEKSLRIRERLAQAEPGLADYQCDLSVSYERLGDLMSEQHQYEAACVFLQKSLIAIERVVQDEPERVDYQRQISVAYSKLGDLLSALGQGERAREFFEKDLAIAQRLAQAEPGRADYQRDLSVSYNKLGDLMSALGQGEQARELFEKSLAIFERLAQAEPNRADHQRDLQIARSRLAPPHP